MLPGEGNGAQIWGRKKKEGEGRAWTSTVSCETHGQPHIQHLGEPHIQHRAYGCGYFTVDRREELRVVDFPTVSFFPFFSKFFVIF